MTVIIKSFKGYFLPLFFTAFFIITSCRQENETYLSNRSRLLENDDSKRFDSDIQLSQEEVVFNQKLVTLRNEMFRTYDSLSFFPVAEPFNSIKPHIEETQLFKLLRKMPKGGILHLHSGAALDFRWVVNEAVSNPNCYVFWASDNEQYIRGQLHFFPKDSIPDGFKSTKKLFEEDPEFSSRLLDLLIFTDEPEADSADIWVEFEKVFQRVYGFVKYQPVFEAFNKAMLDSLTADGIQHVELRRIYRGALYDLDHDPLSDYYTTDSTIATMQRAVKASKEIEPDLTYKSIYTFLRFLPKSAVFNEFVEAYRYRQKYPDIIKGFDLVAEEENGHTTLYFLENWKKIDSLNKVFSTKMDLYLHNGESTSASTQNMYDASILNCKRIGHGFNLMHFPSLIEEVKRKNICLEVSPISNQVLGYVEDLRLHPASLMMKHGVQIALSSDDPAIFDYNGLSYDFWIAIIAWELDLKAIKKLALNSLTYSALSPEEKVVAIKSWRTKWKSFIEYGNEYLKAYEK